MPSGTAGWLVGVIDAREPKQTDQIVEHDEEADAGDERLESLVAVADHLFRLAADELVDHLGDLLRRIGILHREREAHDEEENDEAAGHQNSSAKVSLMGAAGWAG